MISCGGRVGSARIALPRPPRRTRENPDELKWPCPKHPEGPEQHNDQQNRSQGNAVRAIGWLGIPAAKTEENENDENDEEDWHVVILRPRSDLRNVQSSVNCTLSSNCQLTLTSRRLALQHLPDGEGDQL
jgi:hypothetical protein